MNKIHISDLLKLSLSERIILAESLWNSIASEVEKHNITDAEIKILEERLEAYQKAPNAARSWEEVRNDVLKKL